MKLVCCTLMALAIGCGDSSKNGTGGTGGTGGTTGAGEMVQVSGFVIDPDQLMAQLSMGKTGTEALQGAVLSGSVVYADIAPTVKSDPSGPDGSFSLMVPKNSTIHMVLARDESYEPTMTADDIKVGTSSVTNVLVTGCARSGSTAALIANSANMSTDAMTQNGMCLYGAVAGSLPDVQFPSTTSIALQESDFQIYVANSSTAMPGTASPSALYGIFKPGLTQVTSVHIQATDSAGTFHWAPFACRVKPGMITFAGQFPM